MLQARAKKEHFGKALKEFVEVDPGGSLCQIIRNFALDFDLISPFILAKNLEGVKIGGSGRFDFRRAPRLQRWDNVLYVTNNGGSLLGWRRFRRCDRYNLFVFYRNESTEEEIGKRSEELRGRCRWRYIPTNSIWQMGSEQVIQYLEL